jgi:beta-lactamase superfamily II metal-dependent hydrolase
VLRAKWLIPVLLLLSTAAMAQNMEVHHIDVGQGDCTLIIGPTGKTAMIDSGNNGMGDAVILPYLNLLNIHRIDFLISTHMHADHIGGADELLDSALEIGSVYDNGSSYSSNTYRDYFRAAYQGGHTIRELKPGEVLDLGGGATIICVYANGKGIEKDIAVDNENDRSLGLLISYDKYQQFIGGDLGGGGGSQADVEGFIREDVGDLDTLKVNHHGSYTSTGEKFLSTASPETAVISVGENGYGHPHQEVVDRLLGRNLDLVQTGSGQRPYGKVLNHIRIVVKKGKKYLVGGFKHYKDDYIPAKNKPPVADFKYNVSGQTVRFNASKSWDEKKLANYYWNFDDGTTRNAKKRYKAKHKFPGTGTFRVTLVVLDRYGRADSITKDITVGEKTENIQVTATASPADPRQNTTVTISCVVRDDSGQPVRGAQVKTTAHYKSTDTVRTGVTNANGEVELEYYIGNASIGFKVVVDVTANFNGKTATAQTSFTPKQ